LKTKLYSLFKVQSGLVYTKPHKYTVTMTLGQSGMRFKYTSHVKLKYIPASDWLSNGRQVDLNVKTGTKSKIKNQKSKVQAKSLKRSPSL
jgi:PKD repeat protein